MKRLFDMIVSSAGLIVFSPVSLLIALGIKLEDGGPVFFTQERVGRDCRVFTAYKFRSMVVDAERLTGAVQATENDPRVTRMGRILRATAFDELPQLWNILRGDMSVVGPRPLRPGESDTTADGALLAAQRDSRIRSPSPRASWTDGHRTGLCPAGSAADRQVSVRPALPAQGRLLLSTCG